MEAKYDKIGTDYNLTRKADKYLVERLLEHLNPQKEGIYLDVGCGTGNYTIELQKRGFQFIGIDPSEKMLEKAKNKNREIDWKIGTAEKTNLPKNSVHGIIGTLTVHHWTNLNKGFLELESVLKPSGKIIIFTSTQKQMKGYWLNHYFPKMLHNSILQMPSLKSIKEAMTNAGFERIELAKYFIRPDLEDKFLFCGKQNPELYFDEQIRKGISSFSSLANRKEVKQGLLQLRQDIDSGKIEEVINSYASKLGDYLFVIANKSS